jgi:hypothetical protein
MVKHSSSSYKHVLLITDIKSFITLGPVETWGYCSLGRCPVGQKLTSGIKSLININIFKIIYWIQMNINEVNLVCNHFGRNL